MLNCRNKSKYLLSIITVEKDDIEGKIATRSSLGSIPMEVQWIEKSHSSTEKTYKMSDNIIKITSTDTGIYNAMNEALSHRDSEWVLFLNSGDCLNIDLDKLTNILRSYESINTTLIFDWLVNGVVFKPNFFKLRYGSAFSHQAAIISSDQFDHKNYNEKYKLAADYEFFLQKWGTSTKFISIPVVLSKILPGGLSDTRRNRVYQEFYQIQNSVGFNKFFNFLIYQKNKILNYLKTPIKRIFQK
jgi:hypothetical protein